MGFIEKSLMMLLPGIIPIVILGIILIYAFTYTKDTLCTTKYVYHLMPFCEYGFYSQLNMAKRHAMSIAMNCAFTDIFNGPGPDDWETKKEWMLRQKNSLFKDPKALAGQIASNAGSLIGDILARKSGTCGLK